MDDQAPGGNLQVALGKLASIERDVEEDPQHIVAFRHLRLKPDETFDLEILAALANGCSCNIPEAIEPVAAALRSTAAPGGSCRSRSPPTGSRAMVHRVEEWIEFAPGRVRVPAKASRSNK